jgi:glycosyltransferase involved in cell wall biosynthesis
MNVLVNGRFLERHITGVERYGREILRRLGNRTRVVRCSGRWNGAHGHLWEQFGLAGQVHPGQVLWSPANTGPLKIENQVLTVHDLSPLEHPEWFRASFALWYQLFTPLLVRRVRRVVTPSAYIRGKVLRRFKLPGERVTIVPGGVDASVFHPNSPSQPDFPACYALFVGSLQPRKNLPRLIEAWKLVKETLPNAWLLIAGTAGSAFRSISLPVTERIKLLGAVPEADLPGLYANATVFILPSLEEGFGLPALEAMASGTLVLASGSGALPEVIGENALFFNPLDVTEIAAALQRGFQDGASRDDLRREGLVRARRFSWESASELLWRVFEQCQ